MIAHACGESFDRQTNANDATSSFSSEQQGSNKGTFSITASSSKFDKIIIPAIQLDAVTVREAFEALSLILEKQTKDGAPNFVISDPENRFAGRQITLNLKNIPVEGIMKYMAEQAGAKIKYDKYAVLVSPR